MSFHIPEYLNGTALRRVQETLVIAMGLVSSQLTPASSFSFCALTPVVSAYQPLTISTCVPSPMLSCQMNPVSPKWNLTRVRDLPMRPVAWIPPATSPCVLTSSCLLRELGQPALWASLARLPLCSLDHSYLPDILCLASVPRGQVATSHCQCFFFVVFCGFFHLGPKVWCNCKLQYKNKTLEFHIFHHTFPVTGSYAYPFSHSFILSFNEYLSK